MFKITRKRGFHVTYKNGYTVSVQFGPGTYSDNYSADIGEDDEVSGSRGSSTAECAVWANDGEMIPHKSFDGNTVGGRMTPDEVLKLMNWAVKQKG